MKISSEFLELNNLRKKMGAQKTSWKPEFTIKYPKRKLIDNLKKGIALENSSQIEIGPGGLLSYQGEQAIIYIRDTQDPEEVLLKTPENSRKFHLCDCKTIREMKAAGRYDRYVYTNRTDGFFICDYMDEETGKRGTVEAALKVCKNCLTRLNWEGYETLNWHSLYKGREKETRNEIFKRFHLQQFFLDYSTFFAKNPSIKDIDALPNKYVSDWSKISVEVRESYNYRCYECNASCKKHPRLLHVHHINGDKTNNDLMNLRVLCSECHSKQPKHSHLKPKKRDIQLLEKLRR